MLPYSSKEVGVCWRMNMNENETVVADFLLLDHPSNIQGKSLHQLVSSINSFIDNSHFTVILSTRPSSQDDNHNQLSHSMVVYTFNPFTQEDLSEFRPS